MTRIALYGNKRPDADHTHLQQLVDILASLYPHITCSMDLRYMYFLRSNIRLPEVIRDTFTEADPTADLVLSIGGDGTFLKTANRVGILGTPIGRRHLGGPRHNPRYPGWRLPHRAPLGHRSLGSRRPAVRAPLRAQRGGSAEEGHRLDDNGRCLDRRRPHGHLPR